MVTAWVVVPLGAGHQDAQSPLRKITALRKVIHCMCCLNLTASSFSRASDEGQETNKLTLYLLWLVPVLECGGYHMPRW